MKNLNNYSFFIIINISVFGEQSLIIPKARVAAVKMKRKRKLIETLLLKSLEAPAMTMKRVLDNEEKYFSLRSFKRVIILINALLNLFRINITLIIYLFI